MSLFRDYKVDTSKTTMLWRHQSSEVQPPGRMTDTLLFRLTTEDVDR